MVLILVKIRLWLQYLNISVSSAGFDFSIFWRLLVRVT